MARCVTAGSCCVDFSVCQCASTTVAELRPNRRPGAAVREVLRTHPAGIESKRASCRAAESESGWRAGQLPQPRNWLPVAVASFRSFGWSVSVRAASSCTDRGVCQSDKHCRETVRLKSEYREYLRLAMKRKIGTTSNVLLASLCLIFKALFLNRLTCASCSSVEVVSLHGRSPWFIGEDPLKSVR